MLAIIAGTGLYSLGKEIEEKKVATKYGNALVYIVRVAGEEVVFIPRHGKNHLIPPHKINHRANITALREFDVTGVLSIYSAGVISKYKPEDIILIDDFICLSGMPTTFYDDFSLGIHHKDFTNIFNPELVDLVAAVTKSKKIGIKQGGILGTTVGPRYETKAEIRTLDKLGANLCDMVGGFEMSLLGESEINFAAIAVATNYASGLETNPKKKKIKHNDNLSVMVKVKPKIENILAGIVSEVG